jgi:FdhD protein
MSELGPIRMSDRGPEPHRRVGIERWSPDGREARDDLVAAEEPLQVVLDDEPFAVVMRTPGHDLELVLGLLFVEGLIRSRDDVADGAVAASGRRTPPVPDPCPSGGRNPSSCGWSDRVPRTTASAGSATSWLVGCGIAAPRPSTRLTLRCARPHVRRHGDHGHGARPSRAQATFELTGGLHAAGLVRLLAIREDVGRHNAVDKLVGRALLAGELPLHDRALMVSGRASFELAHKAVAAGIPLMAAVSAPSSLAVHVAHTFDLTLVGFLRGERFNVYAGGDRIRGDGGAG